MKSKGKEQFKSISFVTNRKAFHIRENERVEVPQIKSSIYICWPVAVWTHALPMNSTSNRRTEFGGIIHEPVP